MFDRKALFKNLWDVHEYFINAQGKLDTNIQNADVRLIFSDSQLLYSRLLLLVLHKPLMKDIVNLCQLSGEVPTIIFAETSIQELDIRNSLYAQQESVNVGKWEDEVAEIGDEVSIKCKEEIAQDTVTSSNPKPKVEPSILIPVKTKRKKFMLHKCG